LTSSGAAIIRMDARGGKTRGPALRGFGPRCTKCGPSRYHYPRCGASRLTRQRNGHEIIPLMIVHRAREKEIQGAKRKGVLVVQSFEL
jgi:hypothetical protein